MNSTVVPPLDDPQSLECSIDRHAIRTRIHQPTRIDTRKPEHGRSVDARDCARPQDEDESPVGVTKATVDRSIDQAGNARLIARVRPTCTVRLCARGRQDHRAGNSFERLRDDKTPNDY